MSAREARSLIKRVRTVIRGMDEREAIQLLMKAGCSISLSTKLAADRYSANVLRDKTKTKLERFLGLVA